MSSCPSQFRQDRTNPEHESTSAPNATGNPTGSNQQATHGVPSSNTPQIQPSSRDLLFISPPSQNSQVHQVLPAPGHESGRSTYSFPTMAPVQNRFPAQQNNTQHQGSQGENDLLASLAPVMTYNQAHSANQQQLQPLLAHAVPRSQPVHYQAAPVTATFGLDRHQTPHMAQNAPRSSLHQFAINNQRRANTPAPPRKPARILVLLRELHEFILNEPNIVAFVDGSPYPLQEMRKMRDDLGHQPNMNGPLQGYLNLLIEIVDDEEFAGYLHQDLQMTPAVYRPTRLQRTESIVRGRLYPDVYAPDSSGHGLLPAILIPPAHETPDAQQPGLRAPTPGPISLPGPMLHRIEQAMAAPASTAPTELVGYREVTAEEQTLRIKESIRQENAEKQHKEKEKRKRDREEFGDYGRSLNDPPSSPETEEPASKRAREEVDLTRD
jgi:hypothetical protein